MKFFDSRARVEDGTRWENVAPCDHLTRHGAEETQRARAKGGRASAFEHLVAVTLTAFHNIVPRQSSALKHFNRRRCASGRRATTSGPRLSEYFRNLWRMRRMQLVLLSQKIKAKIEQRRGGARFASIGPLSSAIFLTICLFAGRSSERLLCMSDHWSAKINTATVFKAPFSETFYGSIRRTSCAIVTANNRGRGSCYNAH